MEPLSNESWHVFSKVLMNEASDEEKLEFEKWLYSSSQHAAYFQKIQNIWNEALKAKQYDDFKSDEALRLFNSKVKERNLEFKNHKRYIFMKIGRVAAAVILLIGLGFGVSSLYQNGVFTRTNVVVTASGEIKEIILPDNSKVTLAQNSTFEYPAKFASKKRQVRLLGEAFFEVTKNPSQPFIIKTNHALVKVVGTSFDVIAHGDSNTEEVIVATGKVLFTSKENKDANVLVEPGFKGSLDVAQNTVSKHSNNDKNYMAWKTRSLVFDQTPISDVATKLENMYNVKVVIDNSLLDKRLTAKFNNQSIESITDVLKITLNVNIEKSGNTIEISNSKQ